MRALALAELALLEGHDVLPGRQTRTLRCGDPAEPSTSPLSRAGSPDVVLSSGQVEGQVTGSRGPALRQYENVQAGRRFAAERVNSTHPPTRPAHSLTRPDRLSP